MKEIVVATTNKSKVKEIKEILQDKKFKILSLEDVGCTIKVKEDGKTFEENATKKATEIFEKLNKPCIADDSGICIQSLNGWPGTYTARFLGKDATQEERNLAIIDKLKGKQERTAEVICVIAYIDGKKIFSAEGKVCGKIVENPRGENGFGFDSIFELDNGKTLAELTGDEKNLVSARRIALEKLKNKLQNK